MAAAAQDQQHPSRLGSTGEPNKSAAAPSIYHPLVHAAATGQWRLLCSLLQQALEQEQDVCVVHAAALAAAEHGHAGCLAAVLQHSPESAAAADRKGMSVLMKAASRGYSECVQLVLLLHHSCQGRGNAEGSSTRCSSSHRCSSRISGGGGGGCDEGGSVNNDTCDSRGAPRVSGSGCGSGSSGDGGCSGGCISAEALVCARDAYGSNAAMWCAAMGHTACLKLLLAHSPEAQVIARDAGGVNALTYAVVQGALGCARLLLRAVDEATARTQLRARDACGRTATVYAALTGDAACLEVLLRYGSPSELLEAEDWEGMGPAAWAAAAGRPQSLALLLQQQPRQQLLDGALLHALRRCARAEPSTPRCTASLAAVHEPEGAEQGCPKQGPEAAAGGAQAAVLQEVGCAGQHQGLQGDHPRKLGGERAGAGAAASGALSDSGRRQCVEQLLAAGAKLPTWSGEAEAGALWELVQDMARRVLVPDLANEAVVGLAFAALRPGAGRSRLAD